VTCLSAEPEQDAATGRVATRSRFRVLDVLKGGRSSEIELLLPGGQTGEGGMVIPGMPSFRSHHETVLFLTPPPDSGSAWPLGLYQGCYAVEADSSGERRVLLQSGVTPLPDGARFKPTSLRPFRVELDRFKDAVRDALARSGG
jgi:hypothetical protein